LKVNAVNLAHHPTSWKNQLAMASFRRFQPSDVSRFSKCNLDPLTETYDLNFYLEYYCKWPSLFQVCEDRQGNIIGYSAAPW
jgi:hypothetical protein